MSFNEAFRGKISELQRRLRVDKQLLNLLLERRVVNHDQANAVENIVNDYERTDELIQILLQADGTRFSLFCQALHQVGQRDALRRLRKVEAISFQEAVREKKLDEFLDGLQIDFRLLNLLEVKGVISSSQARVVEVELNHDYERAVDELIQILFQADDTRFSLFCEALYEVNQEDKAHWLRTVEAASFNEAFRGRITDFCESLDVDNQLVKLLLENGVINRDQASAIESQVDGHERASELIRILLEPDDSRYTLFCEALDRSGQSEVTGWLNTPVTQTEIRRRPQQQQQCREDESTADDDDDTTDEPKIELKPRARRSWCGFASKILVTTLLVVGVVLFMSVSTDDDNVNEETDSLQANNADKSFEKLFKGKTADLMKKISVTPLLWAHMKDYDLLTPLETEECQNRGYTDADKVACLLNKLVKRDAKLISKFCDALRDTGQSHIVEQHFSEDC